MIEYKVFLNNGNATVDEYGDPKVTQSAAEYQKLKDFINKYGSGHATINVSM